MKTPCRPGDAPDEKGAADPARPATPEDRTTEANLRRPGSPGKGSAVPRLAYRLDEVAQMIGVNRRTLERMRSAGQFPPPDRKVGSMPLWRGATVERWFAEGGGA